MNKTKEEIKLIKETDIKFAERVENMIFNTCGCNKERAIKILKLVIKGARKKNV